MSPVDQGHGIQQEQLLKHRALKIHPAQLIVVKFWAAFWFDESLLQGRFSSFRGLEWKGCG
jgi:hypothetical protein